MKQDLNSKLKIFFVPFFASLSPTMRDKREIKNHLLIQQRRNLFRKLKKRIPSGSTFAMSNEFFHVY